MRNRFFFNAVLIVLALTGFSRSALAQTYGTKGYSPGAWKPNELPKEVSKSQAIQPARFIRSLVHAYDRRIF